MASLNPKIRFMKQAMFPVFCTIVIAYFAYHAINGNRGLIAWQTLKLEAEALRGELADLREQRELLERRVALMRPESLDPDMLDERARSFLNVVREDEIVILRPPAE